MVEQYEVMSDALYHMARFALGGATDDAGAYLQRLARKLARTDAGLSKRLASLTTGAGGVVREAAAALPVDLDSRLELLRREIPTDIGTPIWGSDIEAALGQVVKERSLVGELAAQGLAPTKSVLMSGPPGVGKTLTARWLAATLGMPLFVLDLSAVMSSYLGRTGNNLRNVLDYARGVRCVLLLDEFDAIAKRRDDTAEVGELKRLVTVLLQEIESWPASGLLVAATNHAELLDPAVWRRFDLVVPFVLPDRPQVEAAVNRFLEGGEVEPSVRQVLAEVLSGLSYSDIEREIRRARREAVVDGKRLGETAIEIVRAHVHRVPRQGRKDLAVSLVRAGFSQREANRLTGLHRNTIKSALTEEGDLSNGGELPARQRREADEDHPATQRRSG